MCQKGVASASHIVTTHLNEMFTGAMFESFGKGNRVTVYNDIRTYCTLLHSEDPVLEMHLNLHFEVLNP